ncbi:MAG TPA: glycoside hydrolase family 140 protein [Chitinophagaceae bacterium]|nr:glycoside hydrolase family 140 protein [Chitinophagaceae bacterium]
MLRQVILITAFFGVVCLSACDILIPPIGSAIESIERKQDRLEATKDGHYLKQGYGKPFFWLGDTGWELFHRLNKDQIEYYLENRRQKGFNVVQAVILPEFDGLRKPNIYGDVPLINMDPTKPNKKYFELVDWTINRAYDKDIFMGLLPTWGDKVSLLWGTGPVVFNESNAYSYGLFLGKRYKKYSNIIWILGGDRPPKNDTADWRPIWRAMAKGINKGAEDKAIFSYHISGGEHSTSYDLHNEDWLDINMMQSGHGSGHDVPVWNWIERDRKLLPAKPTLDSEPNYEDHPVNPWPKWDPANGYFRAYDVRKQTYRSVFAGACGVTYGHHSVWQFCSPGEEKINHADQYWTDALDRPGASQVGYLRKLIESRSVTGRIPDQSIIGEGQGEKGEYITAFRDAENKYCMVYMPVGKKISVDLSFLPANQIRAWWFNPKTGRSEKSIELRKEVIMSFNPPTTGIENDWVLIVDDAATNFIEPGK